MPQSSNRAKQPPTVEGIMAILAEVAKNVKEVAAMQKAMQKEADARQQEADARQKAADARQKAADARQKVLDERLDKVGAYIKRIGKQLGDTKNQWGKIAQYLVGADFNNLLKERFGIDASYMAQLLKGTYDGKDWEIDVAGANGEIAVVGEVKATMTVTDIDTFVANNLGNFHLYMPDHRDKKIYGLIAFIKIDKGYEEEVLACARKHGLLVVRAIGKSFSVVTPAGTKLRDYSRRGKR